LDTKEGKWIFKI